MHKRNFKLTFMTFLLFGCATLNKSKPLSKLDFKNHKWQIVYMEDKSPDNGKFEMNIWLLNDNNTINSFKGQYKCNLEKQSDGEQEYGVYIFKDNHYYSRHLFNEKKYVSLGKLKSKLVPVKTSYVDCNDSFSLKTITDSLAKKEIIYSVSFIDYSYKKLSVYYIKLKIQINKNSKLIQSPDNDLYGWKRLARKEFENLYPELTLQVLDFYYTIADEYPREDTPVLNLGNNRENQLRWNEVAILCSDEYFKFDELKLKNSDLFLDYRICPKYRVTIYEKK